MMYNMVSIYSRPRVSAPTTLVSGDTSMTPIIPQKQCTKCKQNKSATTEYFSSDRQKKDGFRPDCKVCNKLTQDKSRVVNADKIKKYRYERYHSEVENNPEIRLEQKQERNDRKEYLSEYSNKYYHEQKVINSNKIHARQAINRAVDKGLITAIKNCKCQKCGKQAQHYHHWNYRQTHWLDVIPLCAECHNKVHGK